jgi:glycosyltransferase involved in cell wall biosynthesis
MKTPQIAIVHDWLVTYAGAERVLEQMLACYPQADLFCVVDFLPDAQRGFLQGKTPRTTFIQQLPGARTRYRSYLPLMPLAIEQLDLSGYDLILSSSHAVAKGILVSPDQLHLCMCYTPIRYAWDLQHQYLQASGLVHGPKAWAARWLLHKMRLWDVRTAHSVDQFIAISHYIARRIHKTYRRESVVIYPPVDTDFFVPPLASAPKGQFYLTASRLVPYKKIATIVEAFRHLPDQQLIVIGDGPDMAQCQAAAGPNVQLLGHQSAAVLLDHLQRAKAFIFAAEEDFGIAPIEAQACGTPVIAYGKGAARETIRANTGLFFDEQSPQAIAAAVVQFENQPIPASAADCRANALRFNTAQFRENFVSLVETQYDEFQRQKNHGTC